MSDPHTPRPKLHLTITTPRGVKFEEEADMIIMRSVDGDLGVLPGHEPLMTVLGSGILKIKNNGSEKLLAVFGGTAEINDKTVHIMSTIAQSPDEIDLGRAEEDRHEAEEALNDAREEDMTRRLQIMQARALVRIHVSHSENFDDIYIENGDDEDTD